MDTKTYIFDIGCLNDRYIEKEDDIKRYIDFLTKKEKYNITKKYSIDPRVTEGSCFIETEHGKELIGTCLRKIFIRLTNLIPEEGASSYSIRTTRNGTLIEDFDREIFRNLGILDEVTPREFELVNPLYPEQKIRGQIDTLIYLPPKELVYNENYIINNIKEYDIKIHDNSRLIVEHKTGYGYSFRKDTYGSKTMNGKPKDNYMLQLCIYLDGYGPLYNLKIPYGYLYYTDRGDCDHKTFAVMLMKNKTDNNKYLYFSEQPSIGVDQNFNTNFEPYYYITPNMIYERFANLAKSIQINKMPPMEFDPMITDLNNIEYLNKIGKVTKTSLEEFKRGKVTYLSSWQCKYCSYFRYCLNEKGNTLPKYLDLVNKKLETIGNKYSDRLEKSIEDMKKKEEEKCQDQQKT